MEVYPFRTECQPALRNLTKESSNEESLTDTSNIDKPKQSNQGIQNKFKLNLENYLKRFHGYDQYKLNAMTEDKTQFNDMLLKNIKQKTITLDFPKLKEFVLEGDFKRKFEDNNEVLILHDSQRDKTMEKYDLTLLATFSLSNMNIHLVQGDSRNASEIVTRLHFVEQGKGNKGNELQ